MTPRISIIIVNYNGASWVRSCIDSLLAQTYKDFEIIFVDNASTDNSITLIEKSFKSIKKLHIIKHTDNSGFSGGNNIGFRQAKGDYILLLNNDTTVGKSFLSDFLKAFDTIPTASIVQSKIVLMQKPNTIDTCGSFWTNTSLLYHYGNSKAADMPIYNKSFRVFTVKGASVMIKREVIDKIGLFDEDTWCYYEETDFCHRAWLSGFESWYWPQAKVFHAQGGTSLTFSNDFIQFHNFKNKLLSFLKNFEINKLSYIIPAFLLVNVLLSLYWLFQGKFKHSISLYKAIGWNIMHLPKTIQKRHSVQGLRKITDSEYLQFVQKNPKISYYFRLMDMRFEKYVDLPL